MHHLMLFILFYTLNRLTLYQYCLIILSFSPRIAYFNISRRVMYVFIKNKRAINGSYNGMPHVWCQAIIWTSSGLFSIACLKTQLNEILMKIQQPSFKDMHFEMLSAKWQLFVLGISVLSLYCNVTGTWGIKIIFSSNSVVLAFRYWGKTFIYMISLIDIYFSPLSIHHEPCKKNPYGPSEEWCWETSLGTIDHGCAGIYNCKLFCWIFDNTWV